MSDELAADLRALWDALKSDSQGSRDYRGTRLALDAPVAVFAALREYDETRCLVFEAPLGAAPRSKTRLPGKGISLNEDRDFAAARYRLAASLEGAGFSAPFEALCIDLIRLAESQDEGATALDAIAKRIATWMAALRRRSGLTDEAARGLIGELHCLLALSQVRGWGVAVSAWTGPDDGLHDLSVSGGAWEIKTSMGPASAVWLMAWISLMTPGYSGWSSLTSP